MTQKSPTNYDSLRMARKSPGVTMRVVPNRLITSKSSSSDMMNSASICFARERNLSSLGSRHACTRKSFSCCTSKELS